MTHLPQQIEIDGQLYERIGIADFDRDSLHTLPLSVVPIKLPALRRARMVKTVALDAAINLGDLRSAIGTSSSRPRGASLHVWTMSVSLGPKSTPFQRSARRANSSMPRPMTTGTMK